MSNYTTNKSAGNPSEASESDYLHSAALPKNNTSIDAHQYVSPEYRYSSEADIRNDSTIDKATIEDPESLLGNYCEVAGRFDDGVRERRDTLSPHGVIIRNKTAFDQLPPRTANYIRQAIARHLMPKHRVAKCLRTPAHKASGIEIRRGPDGRARFYGLQTCGSAWDCAVCVSRISERRAQETNKALKQWTSEGGQVLHASFTVSHTREMTSPEVLNQVRTSLTAMKGRRDYKAAKTAYGWRHDATKLEVTYGRNGCHAHIHMLIFCDPIGEESQKELGRIIGGAWLAAVRSKGGMVTLDYGFDLQGGDYAADYVAKWKVVREVTSSMTKKGRRKGRTSWELLEDYFFGDTAAGRTWQEYSAAFFGRTFVKWSKGAKDYFGLDDESDDAIAAADDTPEFDVWATIDLLTWRCVVMARRDIRDALLRACEADDYAEFQRLLIDAVEYDRRRNQNGL